MTAALPTPSLPAIAHSERLLVVVGPSGAGKDSVLAGWRDLLQRADGPPVHFAQRLVTRPAAGDAERAAEVHEPVEPAEFDRLCRGGALATWWQAHGLSYGVRHAQLAPLAAGAWVVMNGSRAHLPALRRQAPRLQAVEVHAAAEVRAQRLAGRGREAADDVARRLSRELAVPVALRLDNGGALDDAVAALHAWWTALQARPDMHPAEQR